MTVEKQGLVTLTSPHSPVSEAYRALRTNIQFATFENPARTIAVTSTNPDEGKSTVVANLAVAFSQAGNKVILVDADLRRPSLHSIFGAANDKGLTSVFLAPQNDAQLPLQDTGVPNLQLLSSGPLPPNPSEILGSKRMGEIVNALRDKADYVLLDSPPVLAVTDAAVLGHQVDGVLLVVSAFKTKRDHAVKAKMQLEKVGATILGVVLNNAKLEKVAYRYYGS